uniref:ATP-grasp domain-containing protein n=1 Tax=Alexandrium catenella TaxID=2925 RepID=A0A7S1R9F4_ALECA|mmetsp:Transcript_49090/g.131369  ORF Transcript_49090/g.131369 Transcript_49090/m.131369 type:complete len:622 (+) Transcript_49090:88-1953(+)
MGSSTSKCGCFGGFSKKRAEVRPDSSPPQQRRQVKDIQEARMLQRPQEGSFVPSPRPRGESHQWASPVPRNQRIHSGDDLGMPINFDLVIDESQPDTSLAVQMDTDMPMPADKNMRSRSKFEVEQLVASPGSLPKPMTAHQRENAIRSIMPTATYQMLSKLPPDILHNCTAETQDLRRQLSRGATIVFVSAGLPGKRFTFERAAELGMKCVILDHPDSWAAGLVEQGVIAKFVPMDMSRSSEEVYAEALRFIRQLGEDGLTGPADGIATFVELSVPLVARLVEALGLPGHTPAAVDTARNKHATRAALKDAGLPTPRNGLIRTEKDALAVAKVVGFPAVLKPVSGAASLGVKKVTCEEDLLSCYKEIVEELSTLVITSGALIKGDASSPSSMVDASKVIDLTVLCEQYLDGCEVDCDVVMSEGEWRYAAVSDNGPTLEPYFNETWAVSPSLEPKDKQVALKELSVAAVKALGFTSGVFHVECKYTSKGPQLIEVNARMGGGQVRECNLLTWGVDLVEETLFAALGIPAGPVVPRKPLKCAAYCYVNAPKSGTVTTTDGLDDVRRRENVVWAKPLVKAGAQAVGPQDGMPTWLCDLLVTGPTPKEALDFLLSLQAEEPVKVN